MQSTYRLQFHRGFGFEDARKIVGYLSALGITHAYASPYLKARPGSTHGYDVVDPTQLNPEVGSEDDYKAWLAALAAHRMSHILDTVPNHMGVGCNDNPWWNDVLEDGENSIYSDYFDIDWQRGADRKLLLPILGKSYGQALADGELGLRFDANLGQIFITYFERQLPISPASIVQILRGEGGRLGKLANDLGGLPPRSAARLAAKKRWNLELARVIAHSAAAAARVTELVASFNGAAGKPESFDPLHELLEAQAYRLASWKTAPEQINYRRFFDINDLAALRMEREEVFRDVHSLTLQLVDSRQVAGLRVDHPDGMRDPATYFERLQEGRRHGRLYVAIEKILAPDEQLPEQWVVDGTSGYDFLNLVNGLYVDPTGENPLTRLFSRWSGIGDSFSELAVQKKRFILHRSFQGDLLALARRFEKLMRDDRMMRDVSFHAVHVALGELVANFPVYRTYVTSKEISEIDRDRISEAVAGALRHAPTLDRFALHAIADTLLLRWPVTPSAEKRAEIDDFVARFQQLTAPVTAKGVEDTAFYIYNRLISLNEVGNDPGKFGVSVGELHRYFHHRQVHWPTALSCLSTHDTKRSEDVRARINVVSEIPAQWEANVDAWGRLNMPLHQLVDGQRVPSGNDEYLFYQTLLGIWPADGITDDLLERLRQYMIKAMREAKGATDWTAPNAAYEKAVLDFVTGVLRGEAGDAFLKSFGLFAEQVTRLGLLNSISQTILRLLAPGLPDTYQGTELIDLSLVDPDNRRPVDYELRETLLQRVREVGERGSVDEIATQLRGGLVSGQTKLFVTWRLLQLRRMESDLFRDGAYTPLRVIGQHADRVFAFARQHGRTTLIVVVPRLVARMPRDSHGLPTGEAAWDDTRIDVADVPFAGSLVDVLTGSPAEAKKNGIRVAQIFERFPAAILIAR